MYRFCHDKPWARSTRGLPFVERAREFFDQHYFTREWVLEDEDQSDHIWSYYQVLINHHTNASVSKLIEVSGKRSPRDIADELAKHFAIAQT